MRIPEPSEFLVLPIKDLDLIAVFRGSDVSRPLYVNYREFIRFISASISPASALLLQTNGTNNGSQTLLNLIQGSGITIADNGSGGITISASGGGSITADNGLTLTGSNVQLGGSLIQDTTIANAAFNLKLTGNPTTDPSFNSIFTIEATGSGSGRAMIKLIGSGTHGVYLDDSLSGIYGTTTSAAVTILGSGSGDTHNFTPATAFTAPTIKTFNRVFASGTAVNGDYVEIYFRLSDPAIPGSTQTWYIDRLEYTDISAGTAKYVKKIGSAVKASFNAHEIDHLGQHKLNEYGSGTFTGTAAYNLAVDASGNVIEVTAGGGGGVAWGAITGTLSDQTDLQSALDLKANLSGATFTGLLEANAGYDFNATGTQPSEITHSGSGDLNIAHSGSGDIVISKSGSGTILQDGTEFQEDITVPDEAYGVAWNGSLEAPTKNALYDKIETLTPVPDIAIYPYVVSTFLGDTNPLDIHVSATVSRLYLPANNTGTIKYWNSTTNEYIGSFGLTSVASCFYIESTGELWATQLTTGTITRLNATSIAASLGTITGSGTRGVDHYEYSATKVFITNYTSSSVTVVNPSTNAVDATINSASLGGTNPTGICFVDNASSDHDGLLAVILRGTSEIALIDPATNTVSAAGVNPSSNLNSPTYVAYDIATDQYYVCNVNGNDVSVLTPASATTFSHVKEIDGIINPFGIVSDPTTGLIYVCYGGNETSSASGRVMVAVIDPSTNNIVKTIVTPSFNPSSTTVYNIDIDSTNGFIYVNGYSGATGVNIATKLKIR